MEASYANGCPGPRWYEGFGIIPNYAKWSRRTKEGEAEDKERLLGRVLILKVHNALIFLMGDRGNFKLDYLYKSDYFICKPVLKLSTTSNS